MRTLKTFITFTGLAATGIAAAFPQGTTDAPTTGGVGPLVPESIEFMYYQPPWQPTSTSCGTIAGNATLDANVCTPFCVVGVSIPQVADADCLLTVYKGTQTCTHPSEVVSYAIGAGEGGMVCVDVGVLRGCEGVAAGGQGGASVVWSCGG